MEEEAGLAALALVAAADFPPALIALIILLAVLFFVKAAGFSISFPIRSIPALGDAAANAIESAFESMGNYVLSKLGSWAEGALSPVTVFLSYLSYTIPQLFLETQGLFDSIGGFAGYVIQTVIPRAYDELGHYSAQLYTLATDWASGAFIDAYTYINHNVDALTSLINSSVAQLRQDVNTAIADTVAYIDAQGDTLADAAATVYDDAASYASDAAAWATAYTESTASESIDYVERQTQHIYETLANGITDTQSWTADILNQTAETLTGHIDDIDTYLGTTVAAALADAAQWRKECGDPLCSGLLGFSGGLSEILKLISDGVLMAAVAELVSDPAGGAQAAHGALSPVIAAQQNATYAAVGAH